MAVNILPENSAPVLSIESLKTKFDTAIVSNSLVIAIGDFLEARIFQQLHYWSYSKYGVILRNKRWIFKPIREWVAEVLIGFSTWGVRKAIASLVKKGLVLKEKLHKEHFGHNYDPRNRTCYYSLNYDKLQELVKQCESAETIEKDRFVSTTKLVCENPDKQVCDSSQSKTENTINEHHHREPPDPYGGDRKNSSKPPKLKPKEQQQSNPNSSDTKEEIEPQTEEPLVKDKCSAELTNESTLKDESTKVEKPKVKAEKYSADAIDEPTKQKLIGLKIPLNRRVLKAIAEHHESQVLGVLHKINNEWESITNPEEIFLSKISEQKIEQLGTRNADVHIKLAEENERIDAERASPEAKAKFAEMANRLKSSGFGRRKAR